MRKTRPVEIGAWITLIALAIGQVIANRHAMNPDGISYLDLADAWRGRGSGSALNAYWSPLYSWLLSCLLAVVRPSAFAEATAVHVLNLVIFIGTLTGFRFFFWRLHRAAHAREVSADLSDSVLLFAYSVFGWATLHMITLTVVTPDLLSTGLVLLSAGMLLTYRTDSRATTSIGMGVVFGIGYLAKTALLPIAIGTLLVLWIVSRGRGRARSGIALIATACIAAPLVIVLSAKYDRFTIGDAGWLNYAWFAGSLHAASHWHGEPEGTGTPVHAARVIFKSPTVHELSGPVGGSYPFWYDPTYWYEGFHNRFDAESQWLALWRDMKRLVMFGGALLAAVVILAAISDGARHLLQRARSVWPVYLLALIALALYAFILVEPRYVAPFLLLPIVTTAVIVPLERRSWSSRAGVIVMGTACALTWMTFATDAWSDLQRDGGYHEQWEVAKTLEQSGVARGDAVASVGDGFKAYWARLAGIRIVAEVSKYDAREFWLADPTVQAAALAAMRRAGAVAAVSDFVSGASVKRGWQPLGGSAHAAFLLR